MQMEYLDDDENVLFKNVTFAESDKCNMFASQERNPYKQLTNKNSNALSEKQTMNQAQSILLKHNNRDVEQPPPRIRKLLQDIGTSVAT